MKTKKFRNIEDEDPEEPWYPPNYDYVYSGNPRITKRMWNNLDNNLKTGLRNCKILNFDSMGRYGIWQDWEKIPQATREQYGITKYGKSYTNPWQIYCQYIGFTNMPSWGHVKGKELMDPSERNKIYGLDNWSFWYTDPETGQEKLWRGNILPTGSPYSDPWGIAPPWLVRANSYDIDGFTIRYDDGETYQWATAQVSRVCRTIKSRRN